MQVSRPRARKDEERILPLVNIVFLLLIFFMVAGELAARDDVEIAPPVSTSEVPAGTRELLVQMPADRRIVVDGEAVEEGGLVALFRDRMGAAEEPLSVFLKADASLPAQRVVAVLEQARNAGVKTVRLLTVADSDR